MRAETHQDAGSHAGHDHAVEVSAGNERRIRTVFLMTVVYAVVQAAGGLISGSLALLADAGHMLTDAIALGLAYVAFRLGRRAADGQRTFGYARFEVIAGLVNALTLFGIVGFIVYEAIERFQEPQPVLAGSMFVVAIIGMAAAGLFGMGVKVDGAKRGQIQHDGLSPQAGTGAARRRISSSTMASLTTPCAARYSA